MILKKEGCQCNFCSIF